MYGVKPYPSKQVLTQGSAATPFDKCREPFRGSSTPAIRPTVIPHIRVENSACSELDTVAGAGVRRL
jgi:hypothetical protein